MSQTGSQAVHALKEAFLKAGIDRMTFDVYITLREGYLKISGGR